MILSSKSQAEPAIYVSSYDDAVAMSQTTKIPILLIFSADWCDACRNLKNNIADIQNVIVYVCDIDNNKDLMKNFKVRSIPDSILLDSELRIIKRVKGFKDKESYIKWLTE
jgi:thioredoxin-like negative regulator of GroEL